MFSILPILQIVQIRVFGQLDPSMLGLNKGVFPLAQS